MRVIELLLQSDRWGEKLPDCVIAPGLNALLTFDQDIAFIGLLYHIFISDAELG